MRAIIIADDFTGACDTGVRFAAPGEPCPVVVAEDRDTTGGCAGAVELEPAGGGAAAGTPDLTGCDIAGAAGVLVIDTESRHATPDEAASTVRRVAWEIAACDPQIIYKKIDSTLRGNIRAELEVIAATFPERVLVVAPAFPATGRTTRGGRCLVDGVPVDRTEFARDRRSAVRSACIADLVGFAPAIAECSVGELPDVVSRAVPGSAIIVDAERDDELAGIAGIVAGDWRRFLLAGSAGLAGAVAERLRNVPIAPASAAFCDDGMLVSRVVLGLVGSLSERSRRQADVLRKHGEVAVVTVVGDTGDTAAAVVAALRSGRDALVLSPPPSNDVPVNDAGDVAARLGMIARRAVEAVPGVGLFLTGGDTALAAIRALGARGVFVCRETAPGVPAMRIPARVGSAMFDVSAVTKAGGFGPDDAMVEAFRSLREGQCLR